jgi:vanillate O-demethylase monooxygenase subunit
MYPLNCWYVAAWSDEVGQAPLARTLLDEPVVLYRGADGRAIALEDRCPHRNLPLSFGRVQGDELVCGYHGLAFAADGRCTVVPGQDKVPPQARVRSFPLQEQDGLVWFWPGDPALAAGTPPPAYPFHADPHWAHGKDHVPIRGAWQLLNDNLLDLSHVGYVHGKTIGGNPQVHSGAQMRVDREGEEVVVRRWLPDSPPPPTYVRGVGFTGNIDRWMEIRFVPALITIYIGANDVGQGYDEAGHMDKLGIRIFNGITPETATSSHYFWSAAHNFRVDEPEVTRAFAAEIAATFAEDKLVIEAQQQRFDQYPNRPTVQIRADAGGVHARRVIAERLQREQGLARAA